MEKIQPPAILGPEASSPNSIAASQRQKSRKSLIERCQRIIFSAYRTDQYSDPAGYVDSLNLVFGQYPDEVVKYVSDPRTGVQRGCKWPPTIAEIVEACDRRLAELARVDRLLNWGKNQEPAALEGPPREERKTYDELKAKFGDNWGLDTIRSSTQPPMRARTKEELAKHYAEHGLAFKPKKATPG